MIVSWKALTRGAVVAATVALLSSLMVVSVSAQPPTPPDRFFGNVTLNGTAAPAGTNVSADIGGVVCGQTTVKADSTYVLDVVSSGQTTGCGAEGATVNFTVGGATGGTGTWHSGQFTELNLAGVAATPPPPPTVTAVPTPRPSPAPGTGGYLDGSSGTAWWVYTAGGLGLLLLGTAGLAAYRRQRP